MLELGATNEQLADVLGNTPEMIEKYYGQWSQKRQDAIDDLLEKVHAEATYVKPKLALVK